MDKFIEEMLQKLEEHIKLLRDDAQKGKTIADEVTHQKVPSATSHHEILQTYVLLRILKHLEKE